MNKRRIALTVVVVIALAVVAYATLAGGDDSTQAGLTGANRNVKVHSGTTEQAIVQGVARKAGAAVPGVTVEIHEGSASGTLAGASVTGATGTFVFGALDKGPYVLVAKGSEPVPVTVKGNGVTKADITLR